MCSANKVFLAIGLMSGTSADGVDAALLRTDGFEYIEPLGFASVPYDGELQARIFKQFGRRECTDLHLAYDLTRVHVDAVRALCAATGVSLDTVDLVGFHGQTLFHAPREGITVQIGEPDYLAAQLKTPVVAQFRLEDVLAGGQGAPLIPVYHRALAAKASVRPPVAFLNIGGVANVTLVNGFEDDDLIAFDCGPGNALIDDFMRARTGQAMDADGAMAAKGSVQQDFIDHVLARPFFRAHAPKSLDRQAFHGLHLPPDISVEDGAATLAHLTAACAAHGIANEGITPHVLFVCGGGRKNPAIMAALKTLMHCPVHPIEQLGANGSATEAEGFAYLAVRSYMGLPLSFPRTTGVPAPQCGGRVYEGLA